MSHRAIPLGRSGLFALVDEEDYERIAAHRWHAKTIGRYAIRWNVDRTQRIRMHREVMEVGPGVLVDHANGDGLDNRRANLRICTPAQNTWNSRANQGKRFKGVQRQKNGRWRTRIRVDGWLTHIGSFGTEVEAALAYDAAARRQYGEFACVNFPGAGERAASAA